MAFETKNLKFDLSAGLVVFLVAVPLCLGIAAVSNVPAMSGLIAGIVGGIAVGFFSGSQLGVSGPAAGLAVIVANNIKDFQQAADPSVADPYVEALGLFFMAVVIAGAIQFLLGTLKGGIIAYFFPLSVIKGMLAGIGITIFLKEIPHALGYDKDMEGDFEFFQIDGENTFSEILNAFGNPDLGAVSISAIGIILLILFNTKFIKNIRIFQILQGPLMAILAGIGLTFLFKGTSLEIVKEHLVSVPVAESAEEFIGFFQLPNFSGLLNPTVWKVAAVIAIVASLETLLCVEATDKLDPERRVTPTNRELRAQGIGNMISGLIGGLPLTQVIVRSSANIQSNGKTKTSAIFHGFLILGFVAFVPNLLNMIPRASLAAILLIVGFKLAKPSIFKEMYKGGVSQFLPFLVTILVIVFKDLLWGVSIGLAVAIFEILFINFKKPYLVDTDGDDTNETYRFVLAEDVTFLHKASILNTLNEVPNGSKVFIDGSNTTHLHPDVREIIDDFKQHASFNNIECVTTGLDDVKEPYEKIPLEG